MKNNFLPEINSPRHTFAHGGGSLIGGAGWGIGTLLDIDWKEKGKEG